jgi:predicted MFS family arabinose efflux permease
MKALMPAETTLSPATMRPGLVWLMAISTGTIVANTYYAQPLLAEIARAFGLSVTGAGALAMLIQVGTALGQFFFVPLGDITERRRLILILVGCGAAALAVMMTAPNFIVFATGCFLLGTTAATVHVIIPFAAALAPEASRGRVLGKVFSGVLLGILLARTFSGLLGSVLGWRAVFGMACAMMVGLLVLIRIHLPQSQPTSSLPWIALIRSVGPMWKELPIWRDACFTSMLMFSTFSAFWTTLVFFLESPAYRYGSREAGLFGLIGAAGALCAPLVGKFADRYGARRNVLVSLWINVAAWMVMAFWGVHLAGLIVGVLLLDVAAQAVHVSNQTRMYALRPDARSRLNMVYMTLYFTGGSLGSYFATACWHRFGWLGVCGFAEAMMLAALVLYALHSNQVNFRPASGGQSV